MARDNNFLCLHQWFESQVEKTPDAVAVVFEEKRLSYGELNRRANRLAHRLHTLGAGPDVLVALHLERSLEMIVAILGVLKAGAAYLPLDMAYPEERLQFMMQDANASILVTQHGLESSLKQEGLTVVYADEDSPEESDAPPEVEVTPDHLAYCIYTSGSTGTPKGVLITHSNVVRLFTATDHWFGFSSTDVWSMFHSYAFDVSVFELWGALLHGGRLVVVPYIVSRTPADFHELLEREAVTVLSQTPSAFRQLLWVDSSSEQANAFQLRYVIFAGEKLEMQMLKPWFQRHGDHEPKLINMYGITETTVHSTYRQIRRCDLGRPSVIGVPIPDLEIQLLDENLQPVRDGQPGEICVAGPGLARGYLNRDELTAQRFIFLEGTRFYRSGDLARRLPDGDLEYIGRIDHQVKIRGHRIELGEIESVLSRHPAVQDVVVTAQNERLAAYIVATGEVPTVTDLRNAIMQKLPEYMVPAVFKFLNALPLTPNGKVDRKALPDLGKERPNLKQAYQEPKTIEERTLAEIWSHVLDVAPVGVEDNFFELGGDSIRMIQVLALAQEQGLSLSTAQLFGTPTIHALARSGADIRAAKHEVEPFGLISKKDREKLPDDVEDAYPMTALQAGMHFHVQMNPESGVFHDVFSYRVGFPLDARTLEATIRRGVERHEILRTAFDFSTYTEPLQLVHQLVLPTLGVEDLTAMTPAQQHERLIAWINEEKARKFDFEKAPLVRFHVHEYSRNEFQFFVSFHHAVFDGWSLAVMVAEFLSDYVTVWNGNIPASEPPRTHYKAFVAREREVVASTEYQRFWKDHLKAAPRQKLPRWPKSYRQGGKDQLQGTEIKIDAAVFEGLKLLAEKAGAPLRTVLLTAHFRMIQFLLQQDDVISGVVMNGRPEQRDGERMLGLFLNVVPMRMDMTNGSWLELVHRTFETERAILPYRQYPLGEIQKQIGDGTLFEAAFNYVNWHAFKPLTEDLGIEFAEGPYFEANNFTLLANFTLDVFGTSLTTHFDYDPAQLAEQQIKAFGEYYLATLTAMATLPEAPSETFSPLPDPERRHLLFDWNETGTAFPNKCIHELFEDRVKESPKAVALVHDDDSLTYEELNRRADAVALCLQSRGVQPDELVGICMERSLDMVAAMLGILKAGGAYVPFDSSYPYQRLDWMVEDSGIRILLTHSELLASLPVEKLEVICLDSSQLAGSENRSVSSADSDNLAYVLYTSGSTGIPKGVAIPHRAVVRLLFGTDYVSLGNSQTLLHLSSSSFDASTFEVWGALLHGGRCVLFPEKELAPRKLRDAIQRHGVTTLWLTAAYYNAVVDESPQLLNGVKQLLIGGEALSVDHVRQGLQHLPNTRIINGYGPTECTTFACCYSIPKNLAEDIDSIPIGRPIGNTRVYILDKRLQPVPVGVPGELFIAGEGLARGYLNRPELTERHFIFHTFDDGHKTRMYRSGDLARYLPDGNIEFIGRRDHQVKVRGFRVELGEIESALLQQGAVKEAVVVAHDDPSGDRHLVGYVVVKDELHPTVEDLWNFLRDKLPVFMIPGTIIFLPAFPLNANGKIDRNALPAPEPARPELEQPFQEPRTPVEKSIAEIWCEVMKMERIGAYDNFFELGGHSITAIRVIARISNTLEIDVPVRVLFDHPTVAGLAEYIDARTASER